MSFLTSHIWAFEFEGNSRYTDEKLVKYLDTQRIRPGVRVSAISGSELEENIRLTFQVVLQCAPFLKGLKVSCMITMDEELCQGLEEMFRGMDISWYILSRSGGRCLILFYREAGLSAHLKSLPVRRLIREYGYKDEMELSEMLSRLSGRARDFAERDMGFPHEIGAFLGYPAEDVRGFIKNQGRKFLMTGYWKVYSDPERAGIIFKEFDRAKTCAVNEFLTGKSIREIAL